ncbi:MAG: acyltransferase [Candidatus Cybelea sp.]
MWVERHRVHYLDGLRAIAVLLVVVHHAVQAANTPGPLARFLSHGNHGVDLFFVLSGFCLSYPTLAKLRRDKQTSFGVARYAAHRVVRIVPPYWLAIVVTLLFSFVITRLGYPLPRSYGHFTTLSVAQQAFFMDQSMYQHAQFLSAPFWTLPVEFRWYFLFPIVLWLWTKSPKAFALIGIAAFVSLVTMAGSIDATYLPAFLLGIVAADVHVKQVRFGWWPFAIVIPVILYAMVTPVMAEDPRDVIAIWYLAAFAFVIAAGELPWMTRVLSVRALTAVGLASYSIYLIHDPVLTFACDRGVHPALAALLSVAAGFAFWWFAERPFVSTWVRTRLIAEFEIAFEKWMPRIGVPVWFTLGVKPAPRAVDPNEKTFA